MKKRCRFLSKLLLVLYIITINAAEHIKQEAPFYIIDNNLYYVCPALYTNLNSTFKLCSDLFSETSLSIIQKSIENKEKKSVLYDYYSTGISEKSLSQAVFKLIIPLLNFEDNKETSNYTSYLVSLPLENKIQLLKALEFLGASIPLVKSLCISIKDDFKKNINNNIVQLIVTDTLHYNSIKELLDGHGCLIVEFGLAEYIADISLQYDTTTCYQIDKQQVDNIQAVAVNQNGTLIALGGHKFNIIKYDLQKGYQFLDIVSNREYTDDNIIYISIVDNDRMIIVFTRSNKFYIYKIIDTHYKFDAEYDTCVRASEYKLKQVVLGKDDVLLFTYYPNMCQKYILDTQGAYKLDFASVLARPINKTINKITMSTNSTRLVCLNEQGDIEIWLSDGLKSYELRHTLHEKSCKAFDHLGSNADGTVIVLLGLMNKCPVLVVYKEKYTLNYDKVLSYSFDTLQDIDSFELARVVVNEDGTRIVVTVSDNISYLFKYNPMSCGYELASLFKTSKISDESVNATNTVAISGDGTAVVIGSRNTSLQIWRKLQRKLSFEQSMLVICLYQAFKSNNCLAWKQLSSEFKETYFTLPENIRVMIDQWLLQ
ncbi:hypothetical protein KG892_02165 [Vermiphilus pyriformis]|nr:MAG: hypothetical protein KG892_02165 [Vermiphilus pyriformis]